MANIEVSKASEAAAAGEPHAPMDKKAIGLLVALGIAAATQSGEGGEGSG